MQNNIAAKAQIEASEAGVETAKAQIEAGNAAVESAQAAVEAAKVNTRKPPQAGGAGYNAAG